MQAKKQTSDQAMATAEASLDGAILSLIQLDQCLSSGEIRAAVGAELVRRLMDVVMSTLADELDLLASEAESRADEFKPGELDDFRRVMRKLKDQVRPEQ